MYENNGIESLESKGPIQTDLEVKVRKRLQNLKHNIMNFAIVMFNTITKLQVFPRDKHSFASYDYQYTISKDDNTHEKMLYYFKYEGWTDCSVTCGTGNYRYFYKQFFNIFYLEKHFAFTQFNRLSYGN